MKGARHFPTAGPLRRLAALFYDCLLIAAMSMGYAALALAVRVAVTGPELPEDGPAVGGIWFQCGWLATIVVFYSYFWHRGGQTLGMRAWRLRLISSVSRTDNPSWSQCLLRCLVGPFSVFCAGVGYWWCYIDKNGHSLHDLLTKTQVIVLPKRAKAEDPPRFAY